MIHITQLPLELNEEILSYFEYDRVTLRQLAFVSTYFRDLAQQILWRHLELCADWPGLPSLFDQIFSFLDRGPKLAAAVRTLTLSWSEGGDLDDSSKIGWSLDHNNQKVLNLLGRLSCLEYLEVSNCGYSRTRATIYHPILLQLQALSSLKKIKTNNHILASVELNEVLSLPSLQEISLFLLEPLRSKRLAFSDRPVLLKKLDLQNWRGPGPFSHHRFDDHLGKILEKTTSLETLSIHICDILMQAERFSSRNIGQVLAPLRYTLTSLTILGKVRDAHDSSRLDLSAFTNLKTARLLSQFFFPTAWCDPSRNGMYTCLPRSLLDLEISFSSGIHGILCHIGYNSVPSWLSGIGQPGWELDWAMELAVNKATHFPEFRSLLLLENVDTLHYFHQEFFPPEALRMAFEENSVAFRGLLRVLHTRYHQQFHQD